MSFEVTFKGKKVKIKDWELEDKYAEVYEAEWTGGKPLTEDEVVELNEQCASEILEEAQIDHEAAMYDRAKDYHKYGE